MDEEWAIGVLDWWVKTAKEARVVERGMYSTGVKGYIRSTNENLPELRAREDQTRRVLARALGIGKLPVLLSKDADGDYWVQAGIDQAEYALGRLKTDAETTAKLGGHGPSMSADALHPLVWDAASKRWDAGHYSDAVQRAATFLNAEVQDRTRRTDASDSDLMKQTFSLEPPQVGKPRLRWPGDDQDLTVRAMRVGILNMAQGVFSAIRNPATHSTDDMESQEALEQLATLSILCRWIERCELVTVD